MKGANRLDPFWGDLPSLGTNLLANIVLQGLRRLPAMGLDVLPRWVDLDTDPSHFKVSLFTIINALPFPRSHDDSNFRRPVCKTPPSHTKFVFSDEFNTPGRDFTNGKDARWTALDEADTVNDPLEYYTPSHATTKEGFLEIKTTNKPASWKGLDGQTGQWTTFTRHYSSAMLQTWNKFCFTGGVLEVAARLPGNGVGPGLWPAAWLMGNLVGPHTRPPPTVCYIE